MEEKPVINEVIVVEGRDDTAAINKAVEAVTIETHGYGISAATWKKLDKAYETKGLIVMTDPDHAGRKIRERICARYPDAKQAFLTAAKAEKNGDIGIENARPEDIVNALKLAKCTITGRREEFSSADLSDNELIGCESSKERRTLLGDLLGLGYCNGKSLLKKLNLMGVSRKDFDEAIRKVNEKLGNS